MSLESIVTQICSFLVQLLAKIIPYLAVISITVNFCHVIVLFQRGVTSSSMNMLLIGIGIVDILSPMVYVKRGVENLLDIWQDFCQIPSYNDVLLDLILGSLSENFRRCSTWLGLLLAVTRTVSVKLAVGKNSALLTQSKFGVTLIICTVILSMPIAIPYLIRYQIVESAAQSCQLADGQAMMVTRYTIQEFAKNKTVVIGGSARTVHILLTGVFGQLMPSVLFPIFASILIYELRQPDKKNSKTVKTDKISKMVVYMTVTFLVIEFPIGIGKIFNSMQTESTIPHDSNQIFHYLYVPMTLMHCFICLSMSSQYRKAARKLLGLDRKICHKNTLSTSHGKFSSVPR
ncbi:hypothetical protein CRE_23346 [Caenorhabditis remanei]|uniref:G-protein coupled receptors family 1 profile domain-containing protein n=1 Tax=Caenorhabditis remanei TaxID=31234 RepID=E3MGZ4_CAERE|nr:hypothetical protein CRE_23346 [Caenorhabditis remanei]